MITPMDRDYGITSKMDDIMIARATHDAIHYGMPPFDSLGEWPRAILDKICSDVNDLMSELVPDPCLTAEVFSRDLARNPQKCAFLAVDMNHRKVVGMAVFYWYDSWGHGTKPFIGQVENLITHYQYRNMGIGRKLLAQCIKTARLCKCYKVILSCSAHNREFYKHCDFLPTDQTQMRYDLV